MVLCVCTLCVTNLPLNPNQTGIHDRGHSAPCTRWFREPRQDVLAQGAMEREAPAQG